jgi:hypothetical protein
MSEKPCIKCYSLFIPRNKNCDICTNCKKPNKCEHGTSKGRCKIDGCFGNEICEHKQHKQKCTICKPGVKDIDKLNAIMRKLIVKIVTNKDCSRIQEKTKKFISDLFVVDNFINVIEICQKKIQIYEEYFKQPLNINYFQIDHIKPKSKFNLMNQLQFAQCCHHTNLQIVPKHTNLQKNNKWTDEDELFWSCNIIHKQYDRIY